MRADSTRPWNPAATRFVLLNVAGGVAVLGSYAWGIAYLGDDASRAWGGVPSWLKPFYQASMLFAATGYFPMTWRVLEQLRQAPAIGSPEPWLYAGILAGSSLWLPLTCGMLESPSTPLWWLIRIDLAVVGLSSLAMLGLLVLSKPSSASRPWIASVAGAAAFCLQTAVLDAIVWPAYFFTGR